MIPKAVAKAAIALKEASIMFDVLMDLDAANLRALAMALVASVVEFEEVAACWFVVAAPSPPKAADETNVAPYVVAMISLSSNSSLSRRRTSKR